MKFRDFFDLKQIVFAVCIILLMGVFALIESNKVVKVEFQEDILQIQSDKYVMKIAYDEILSAELSDTPQDDEAVDGVENIVTHYSTWTNEEWGEYIACLDMNSPTCIVLKLTDGQTYVFSRKSTAEMEKIYQELLTHIG